MRKHIHTALVVCLLALPCAGQWTEVWTNGDLYAIQDMASQCYSASVERCQAVGVTPDEPSWWDYIVGKNHAKLVSVKANITACIPYYGQAITNYPGVDEWTNSTHFLSAIGLPTNALSETPYFSTQQAGVTGGWHHTYAMLTNLNTSYVYTDPYIDADVSIAWIGEGNSSNSLAEAYAAAESDWHNDDFYSTWPAAYVTSLTNSIPAYYVSINRALNLKNYASNSLGMARNVAVWVDPETSDIYSAFNGHGDYTNDSPLVITNITGITTDFTIVYGNTNLMFDSSVCVESNHSYNVGWIYYDAYVISDWSTPSNGFKFK